MKILTILRNPTFLSIPNTLLRPLQYYRTRFPLDSVTNSLIIWTRVKPSTHLFQFQNQPIQMEPSIASRTLSFLHLTLKKLRQKQRNDGVYSTLRDGDEARRNIGHRNRRRQRLLLLSLPEKESPPVRISDRRVRRHSRCLQC